MKHKILIIDDDRSFIENITKVLSEYMYELFTAATYKEGFGKIKELSPDIIILSLMMLEQNSRGDTVKTIIQDAGMRGIPIVLVKEEGEIKLPSGLTTAINKLPVKSILPKSEIEKILLMSIKSLSEKEGEIHRQIVEKVKKLVKKWQDKQGNLIMILHEIQNEFGYVPRTVSFILSQKLNISLARIYEVITFYNFFRIEAPGQHIISVCMGTACYLKGAPQILQEIKNLLNIDEGKSSTDGLFYLQVVRCLGCCGLAPVITIDDKVYGQLTKDQIIGILSNYAKKGAEENVKTDKRQTGRV